MAKKMGAPSKKNKKREKAAISLARAGATDKEIADKIGVTEQTINNWKKKYPDFFEALKEAKEFTDDLAEGSLLKLALGYEAEEVKCFYDKDRGEVIEHRYKRPIAPNITALIFWLKNRRAKDWRSADKDPTDSPESANEIFESLNVMKLVKEG